MYHSNIKSRRDRGHPCLSWLDGVEKASKASSPELKDEMRGYWALSIFRIVWKTYWACFWLRRGRSPQQVVCVRLNSWGQWKFTQMTAPIELHGMCTSFRVSVLYLIVIRQASPGSNWKRRFEITIMMKTQYNKRRIARLIHYNRHCNEVNSTFLHRCDMLI